MNNDELWREWKKWLLKDCKLRGLSMASFWSSVNYCKDYPECWEHDIMWWNHLHALPNYGKSKQ